MATPPSPDAEVWIRRREGVESRPVPDGAVLVDMQTGRCFELNKVGAEIWRLLATPAIVSQLSGAVATMYLADYGVVRRDVDRLVVELERELLVERIADPAPVDR